MSLYGPIKEVQNATEKSYLNLAQRFSDNKLIASLWSQMAHDVSLQMANLHDLPRSFWTHLKKDEGAPIETTLKQTNPQSIENKSDISLRDCIEDAIRSEEAIILKIYIPIIRKLRKNGTGRALDFYIMVKAHIVRIKRMAEAFAGDPAVLQDASLLFEKFEKEVQEPEAEVILREKHTRKNSSRRERKSGKPQTKGKSKVTSKGKTKAGTKVKPKAVSKAGSKSKKSTKQAQSLAGRSKMRRSRSKPLVGKSSLRRNRARG